MTNYSKSISVAKPLRASLSLAAAAALLTVSSLTTHASPLQQEHVPGDSKWLLHLDVDAFRQGKIGKLVVDKLIESKLAELRTELPIQLDFSATNINAITVFGSEYDGKGEVSAKAETAPKSSDENKSDEAKKEGDQDAKVSVEVKGESGSRGALLIQTDKVTATKVHEIIKTNVMLGLTKVDAKYPLYKNKDDAFFSVRDNGLIIISKSAKDMESAQAVIEGKGDSITKSKAFGTYPAITNSFFFLAVAESFNMGDHVPPQAKVLQQASGARIVLGETADKLFLQLALKTKTAEASQQIQQVVQGIIAMISLGQVEEPEIAQLVQSAKLSATDNMVTLGLELPIKTALAKIEEEAGE